MNEENLIKPIFIGGTGRSGTTILKRILSLHSEIVAIEDELRILTDPGGVLDLIQALSDDWSPYHADIAIHQFRDLILACGRSKTKLGIKLSKVEKRLLRTIKISPQKYLGVGLSNFFGKENYETQLNTLLDQLSFHTTIGSWIGSPPYKIPSRIYETIPIEKDELYKIFSSYIHSLYAKLATQGQKYWLDDTPTNILHANKLLSLFPNLKLIHIYRDPRDVTASYYGFSWGGDDYLVIAKRIRGIYDHWLNIREKLPKESFLEISLETLANHPNDEIVSICEFIGIKFEKLLMQIQLNKVHSGRWKQDIPQDYWNDLSHIFEPYLELYGYK